MTTGEVTRQFNRANGSFELAFSPLIMALIGLWLDHRFGTLPLFVIILAVFGFVGVGVKMFYTYRYEMAGHSEHLDGIIHGDHTDDGPASGTAAP